MYVIKYRNLKTRKVSISNVVVEDKYRDMLVYTCNQLNEIHSETQRWLNHITELTPHQHLVL